MNKITSIDVIYNSELKPHVFFFRKESVKVYTIKNHKRFGQFLFDLSYSAKVDRMRPSYSKDGSQLSVDFILK